MERKGMMAIEIMVLIVLAVIVMAVLIGLVIFGGQKPTSDLGKQTFVRSCCQLNMPLTCNNPNQAKCTVSEDLKSTFGPVDDKNQITLTAAADKIGIAAANVKLFCGCG